MAKKQAPKLINPHMRITNAEEIRLFEDLKKATNEKTYSGAILKGVKLFFDLQKEVTQLEKENTILDKQLHQCKETLTMMAYGQNMLQSFTKKYKLEGKYPQGELF